MKESLEELIYEYGHTMYTIGRYETDDKQSMKDYNRLCKRRDEIKEIFDSHFKTNKKIANTLNMV